MVISEEVYHQNCACRRGSKPGLLAANAVRLELHALTYNLANFLLYPGAARGGEAVVADHTARAVSEDRSPGRPARPLDDLPDGRGRGAPAPLREDARRYRDAAPTAAGPMLRTADVAGICGTRWEECARTPVCAAGVALHWPLWRSSNGASLDRSAKPLLGSFVCGYGRQKLRGARIHFGNVGV